MALNPSWSYGTVAAAGGLFGIAVALWLTATPWPQTTVHRLAAPMPAASLVGTAVPTPPASPVEWSDLRLSPAALLDTLVTTSGSHKKGKVARRASRADKPARQQRQSGIAEYLDLNLPAAPDPLARLATAPDRRYRQVVVGHAATAVNGRVVVFPALGLPGVPQSTSPRLFNRDSGLRGFMARNWVNSRFGVQGGLAIRQGRLQHDNSTLQDNIAVGMGVLLAF